MKVEIKTNDKGICEYFKIDGKNYGLDIYSLDIHIDGYGKPDIFIRCKSDEFIMTSDNTKLYIDNLNEEDKMDEIKVRLDTEKIKEELANNKKIEDICDKINDYMLFE